MVFLDACAEAKDARGDMTELSCSRALRVGNQKKYVKYRY